MKPWQALVSFAVLNAGIAFDPAQPSRVWPLFVPSIDVVVLVALAGATQALRAPRARVVGAALGVAYLIGWVHRLASTAIPQFFGRPLQIELDLWLLPNFYDLLFDSLGTWRAVGVILVSLLALPGAVALVAVLIRAAALPFSRRPAVALLLVAVGTGMGLAPGGAGSEVSSASRGIARAVTVYRSRDDIDRALEKKTFEALSFPDDLEALAGADVYVFFVESYGRTLWRRAEYRERFEPLLRDYDRRFARAGVYTASKFALSPVKGGGSWLAHATFQSGVDCDNQICYDRLLESGVTPLTGYFRRKGYRTISVLPAVDIDPSEWPAGAFFQFDENFWHEAIGFDGPRYGWSPVPDQFAIRAFQHKRLIASPDRPPIFAEMSLTTSHPPFRRVPPYLEDTSDLDTMLRLYQTTPWLRFDNSYGSLNDRAAGYTAAIGYSVRSVLDFVLDFDDRPYLAIVLGDHQPITTIQGPGGKQVPVHVLSRDPRLIDAFIAHEFKTGLIAKGGSRLRMSGLLELILSACSSRERT